MTSYQNNGVYNSEQQAGYSGGPQYAGPVYSGAPAAGYQQPTVVGYASPQTGLYPKLAQEAPTTLNGFGFDSIAIRQAFVRKVYLILMLQLLVTFGFAAYFTYNEQAKLFAWQNMSLVYVCLIATFILIIVMSCCESTRRTFPLNFILLSVFTLSESLIVGFIASVNEEKHVLIAVGMTVVICFALTLFAFQTKIDFTGYGTYLFIAAIVLMIFGFITIFFQTTISVLIYSSLGALLFSFYLVYDTQVMLGGKHKCALSPEEYIFASLSLYLDIVNIFLFLLNILNISSSD